MEEQCVSNSASGAGKCPGHRDGLRGLKYHGGNTFLMPLFYRWRYHWNSLVAPHIEQTSNLHWHTVNICPCPKAPTHKLAGERSSFPWEISNTFIVGQAERNRKAQTTILTSMYQPKLFLSTYLVFNCEMSWAADILLNVDLKKCEIHEAKANPAVYFSMSAWISTSDNTNSSFVVNERSFFFTFWI